MTTLIVLPTPPAPRTPAPATGETGDDTGDAGRFAALLDAAMATGTDGAPSDGSTTDATGSATDGATTPGALLTLVPPLAEGADGEATDATDGTPADVTPAAPVDGASLLLASGAVLGGAVPPQAPASPTPEPDPADAGQAAAAGGTSTLTALGDAAATTPTTATGAAVRSSPHPGAGATTPASTASGEGPAEATPQSAEASTDRGDLTTEAPRPGEVAGSGFGHAERSGAGGTPRPAAPSEASGAVEVTSPQAPPATTATDRASGSTSPTATETTRPVAAQVLEQLDARWPAVRSAGPGTHVMTLRLEPEHFGPLRVVAHIGAEGVRIELLGATDAARDALRQALPDLKRDLVGVGLTADLDLSSRGQNGQGLRPDGGASGDASGRGDRADQGDRPASGPRAERPAPDGMLPTQTTAAARRGRLDLTV